MSLRGIRLRMRRLGAEQAGWTLVELMVVVGLLGFVLAAVLSLFSATEKVAPEDAERAAAVRDAQVGIHTITRELRSAYQLDTTSPYYLSARLYVRGTNLTVAYDCSGAGADPTLGSCVRTVLSGGPASNHVLVKAPVNKQGATPARPPVFTYTTRPDGRITYVNVHVETAVRARANGRYYYRLPLNDGAYLRNLDD
jgi:type II secretory pathway pseudopilin PulG